MAFAISLSEIAYKKGELAEIITNTPSHTMLKSVQT